jgi:hypothetical protein
MASGLGPNFILPIGKGFLQQLTGQAPTPGQPWGQGQQWFSPGAMQRAGGALDYGALGGWSSSGPQSTSYQKPGFPLGDPAGAGLNTALFGHTYDPNAGQSAYERFNDAGDSYLRRFGTDLYGPQGNIIGLSPEHSAGLRSFQDLGGRDASGNPLYGSQYDTAKNLAGLATLQQGANPWLNDPRMAASMVKADEASSPFARADPKQYLATMLGAEGTTPTTASVANSYVNPTYDLGGRSVGQMGRMTNAYEQTLMDQIANQGSKDLSLGLQDAQSTLSSMGLGRSGQGQSTAAGVWEDIQQKNALDRSNLLAQFREAGMGRQAQAIMGQQQGGINAMLAAQQAAAGGAESRLGRANQAAMGGMNALTASLEASRAAQRGALTGGMANTAQWNQGVQQNYLNALTSGDQAALARMQATGNQQSQGLADYMRLQATKDAMRSDRLNEMLSLEDRYRTTQNEKLNQMAQYSQMPLNWIMQMVTGISPTGGSPARTSPWASIGGQLGAAAIGAAPSAYSSWQNTYNPEPP